MVFGLFARKPTLDDSSPDTKPSGSATHRLPTPTPSLASVSRPSPLRFSTALFANSSESTPRDSDLAAESATEGSNAHSSAPPPPPTPSPPPVGRNEKKALVDLMLTIPPKTLHAYTLTHLRSPPPPPPTFASAEALGSPSHNTTRPPSPDTVAKLTAFFQTLAPPPSQHCVRCHKDFYEIENEEKDKACRIAHDDDSALVTRLPGGAGYETLWSCCGQAASGDGSEGPPDGWCYEGRHTIDIKRARFRADSTIHNDKLTSCLRMNCHGIRDQLPRREGHASPAGTVGRSSARRSNPSPARSQISTVAARSMRKRPRQSLKESSSSENEADAENAAGAAAKENDKFDSDVGEGTDTTMALNELDSKPKSKTSPRRRSRLSVTTAATPPTSGKSPASTKESATRKPKSMSRALLSQSHMHPPSDSEGSTHSRPRTRSRVRDESRGRTSKATKVDVLERVWRTRKVTSASEEETVETNEHRDGERETRGRERKRRRVRRG